MKRRKRKRIEEVKDVESLKANWEHLFENLKVYGKEIKMKGVNLLEEPTIDGYNVRPIRSNYYLKQKGELAVLGYPEKLSEGDWTVKFHVYVVKGDGAEITEEKNVKIKALEDAEVLFIDLPK